MKKKHISTKYSGKTFAQASKKISDKYKDRDLNPLSKRSFLAEIEELIRMQEVVRAKEAAIDTMQENRRLLKEYGGKLQGGGFPGFPIKGKNTINPAFTNPYQALNQEAARMAANVPEYYLSLADTKGVVSPIMLELNNPSYKAPVVTPRPVAKTNSRQTVANKPVVKQAAITAPVTQTPTLQLATSPILGNEVTLGRPLVANIPSTVSARNITDTALTSTTPLRSAFPQYNLDNSFQNSLATAGQNALASLRQNAVVTAQTSKDAQRSKFLSNMLSPLALGKSAELLGKGIMASTGYDRYSPIMNPYESQSRRELEEMRFDITPIQQRIQQEAARGRSSVAGIQNEAVRQALLQNTQSEVMGRTQEAMLTGQQQENQYRQARAAGLQGLGAEQVRAREMSRNLTTASKAQLQSFVNDMLSATGQAGQEITNTRASVAQQQLLASTLKTKNFAMQDVKSIFDKARQMGMLSEDDLIAFTTSSDEEQDTYLKELNKRMAEAVKKPTETKSKGGWLASLKL